MIQIDCLLVLQYWYIYKKEDFFLIKQNGLGAESPKPSHWGLVTGAPLETAVGGDGGRWYGGGYEVAVVWW
jgi:hypothetical protein